MSPCRLKEFALVLLLGCQSEVFAQVDTLSTKQSDSLAAGRSISPLPQAVFNLLSFTGSSSLGQNTLSWKTDSRSHFSGFTLERSVDEIAFSAIGDVAVSGLHRTNSFTYVDSKPLFGRNFYRLKMTDSSGKNTYSAIAAVAHSQLIDLQIHFDSPSGMVGVTGMETGGQYQLKVYNCNGQIAFQKMVTAAASSISISNLPHGLYVVYATDGVASTISCKIIW